MEEIKLLHWLDDSYVQLIADLEKVCINYDQTALKLELDYKLAVAKERFSDDAGNEDTEGTNSPMVLDYLYFIDNTLVGYLGICSFGGHEPELNGMVHPNYRKQGIFSKLFALSDRELHRKGFKKSLLLCDRKSESGQAFIKSISSVGLKKAHSEYEMFLNYDTFRNIEKFKDPMLRKSTNQDALEIASQNAIYFGRPLDETKLIMPETEEKRGMTVYMAYLEDQCIGKIHLELSNVNGGIYGVGILPDYRGNGYGRHILMEGISILMNQQAKTIKLQVEAENENALGLYLSCGFEATSTMDYYIYNDGSR